MQIDLNDAETDYLQRALTQALSELRMEIRATDSRQFKQRLEQDQSVLRSLLVRLGVPPPEGVAPEP